MGKGNSGIDSKFQTKLEYSTTGVIGDTDGYEVLKEVVLRFSPGAVQSNHSVRVCGRMSTDTKWYEIGKLEGPGTDIIHIASWDYIMFECLVYSCGTTCTLISSAFFSDGMFVVRAIDSMNASLQERLDEIISTTCDLKAEIKIINRQIEIITDHEEDEVK